MQVKLSSSVEVLVPLRCIPECHLSSLIQNGRCKKGVVEMDMTDPLGKCATKNSLI